MAEKPALDPRYSPVFQRGFDPGQTAPRADPASTPAEPAPASVIAPPPAARPREAASARSAAPATDDSAHGRGDRTAGEREPETVAVPAPIGRAPWANPFVVALAVIGVLCIAGGVSLIQLAMRDIASGVMFTDQGGYVLLQVIVYGSPMAIATGVLILAAVLVLFAVHWSRMPVRDAD